MVESYSFFALLFLLARGLAPGASAELAWINGDHPDETIAWTRGEGGEWSLSVNGRDVGLWSLEGDAIVHATGIEAPRRYPIAELSEPVRAEARRVALRGEFAPAVLTVQRGRAGPSVRDPSRTVLGMTLRLSAR
ncbi:MAG: hypothetical protein AB7S26_36150 [Sandaracinaceae bacterium]